MGFWVRIFLLTILTLSVVDAQITAKQAVMDMFRGYNIGDSLDAPGGETAWGNPIIEEYYFDDFKDKGLTAIRIPVTWTEHTSAGLPYTVDQIFMNRVETIVDWGLKRGFYIVLNAHHEGWLKNPSACVNGQCGPTQINQDRFNAIWSQIAQKFKDKSYQLLFEILNEPETMSVSTLDQIHSRVYKTIRSSGGKNDKRIVVVSGSLYSDYENLKKITLPDNDHTYLIANFHCYDPWSFVSDLTGGPRWGSDQDKKVLRGIFDSVNTWKKQNNVEISFNEWGGSFELHDYQSIVDFYQAYVQMAAEYNFAPFAWDDGYEFTTYIRKERKWMGDLIDIMTNPVFSKTGMKAVGWFDANGVKKVAGGGDHFAGNINSGSWISYRFDVPKTSQYKLDLDIASSLSNGVISIESTTGQQYASFQVASTGGDQTWKTITKNLNLQKGLQTYIFRFQQGGFNFKRLQLIIIDGPPVNVTGVNVTPLAADIAVNEKFQLTATVTPDDASNQQVQWASTDIQIATVDVNGIVTGKAVGTTTITVTTIEGQFKAVSAITIKIIPVEGISLTPSISNVQVGKTNQLQVTFSPPNASNRQYTITSSDTTIAKVDQNGLVSGVSAGSAIISLTSQEGAFKSSATVTVTKPACPEWQQGVNYKIGTVVTYKDINYTSNNDWTGSAPDPFTATHTNGGWGWVIGGTCSVKESKFLQFI